MRRTWMAACACAFVLAGTAFGSTTPVEHPASTSPKARKTWLRTWFEHLKQGLSESAVQGDYQRVRVTAVAAVRGNQQQAADQNKPSWKAGAKGKKSAALKAERREFSRAVDLILEGKVQEGVAALDAFEKAHPKSTLVSDVREAREKAREMQAAPEPVEAAPAAAPAGNAQPDNKADAGKPEEAAKPTDAAKGP